MRFLADESCDFAIVRTLRRLGYDVAAVGEVQQRSIDPELMEWARREGRILLTEDKDFGWLAFVAQVDTPGVVLFRFPAFARQNLARDVTSLIAEFGPRLKGAFVVVTPGSVRISAMPSTE
jgi:predicted nuclease of predicted toxin-antitoxin system